MFQDEMMDKAVTETYMGEWKNDKRAGFGIAERSDGLKYEGEWFNNKKYGYGVTTFKDSTKEEGKYKNNVLITSQKKKHLFIIRSAKFRERIDAAVNSAQRASKFALQKADIAISRAATARGKGELADTAADVAREDSDIAIATAHQFAPDFQQPMSARAPRPARKRSVDFVPPSSQVPPEPPIDTMRSEIPSIQHTSTILPSPPMSSPLQPLAEVIKPSTSTMAIDSRSLRGASVSRNSQPVTGEPPGPSFQQAMSDHFDHYKRPPSRDPSVDRMSKGGAGGGGGGGRMSLSSRQPSVDKTSVGIGATNGSVTGLPASSSQPQPYVVPAAEQAVRRRTPAPDLAQPKRTESLFVNSSIAKGPAPKGVSCTPTVEKSNLQNEKMRKEKIIANRRDRNVRDEVRLSANGGDRPAI